MILKHFYHSATTQIIKAAWTSQTRPAKRLVAGIKQTKMTRTVS